MASVHAPGEQVALRQVDPTVADHANRIVPELEALRGVHLNTQDRIRAVWERVAADDKINKEFAGAAIRAATMRGRVANRVMELLGDRPDFIQMMSIGDVDLPSFVKPTIDDIYGRAHQQHVANLEEHGTCYDLASKGLEKARRAMVEYFDPHYGFSNVPGMIEALTKNACITNGGMRALDDIVTGMIKRAQDRRSPQSDIVAGATPRAPDRRRPTQARPPDSAPSYDRRTRPRFIYPDNSFGTWGQILNLRSSNGQVADLERLPTSQDNRLHLGPKDVADFYTRNNPETGPKQDTWYITPVGNPSGTKMTPSQLFATCNAIIDRNPQAIIILDSVYVRTLPPEKARELFAGVINMPAIMDRVIIVESFSKTHGLCGERIGTYMSINPELFDAVQNVNMTLSAGNGHFRSAIVQALCDTSADQETAVRSLHEFWAQERRGLRQYLLGNDSFAHIFDPDQSHIVNDDLENPLGLYLFVKLLPGISSSDVLYTTGCLGVETNMTSGTYMRFSVGKSTEPAFAKYIQSQGGSDHDASHRDPSSDPSFPSVQFAGTHS